MLFAIIQKRDAQFLDQTARPDRSQNGDKPDNSRCKSNFSFSPLLYILENLQDKQILFNVG